MARRRQGRSNEAARQSDTADFRRRHRDVFQGAAAGAVGYPHRARRGRARGCGPKRGRRAGRASRPAARASTLKRRRACARAIRNASCARLRFSRPQARRSRVSRARAESALLDAAHCQCVFLAPEREKLNAAHRRAFRPHDGAGALEEARRLLARGLDPRCRRCAPSAFHGFSAFLRGEMSLEAAVEKANATAGNMPSASSLSRGPNCRNFPGSRWNSGESLTLGADNEWRGTAGRGIRAASIGCPVRAFLGVGAANEITSRQKNELLPIYFIMR